MSELTGLDPELFAKLSDHLVNLVSMTDLAQKSFKGKQERKDLSDMLDKLLAIQVEVAKMRALCSNLESHQSKNDAIDTQSEVENGVKNIEKGDNKVDTEDYDIPQIDEPLYPLFEKVLLEIATKNGQMTKEVLARILDVEEFIIEHCLDELRSRKYLALVISKYLHTSPSGRRYLIQHGVVKLPE